MSGPYYTPKLNHADRLKRRLQIAEEVKAGGTLDEVAHRHDVTWSTVRLACIEHGVKPPRTVGRLNTPLKFKILFLLVEGEKKEALAKRFNTPLHFINDIARYGKQAGFTFKRIRS